MIRRIVAPEAAGGIALIAAAALALIVANSPAAYAYHAILSARIGPLAIHGWIDDGLMAVFFLGVGLEIKRELAGGRLATWADRALPGIAALGGMIVPALVYLAVTAATPGLARGWAIPAATDIAFAIGVVALLGRHVPRSLKLLLTAVAIVDDMGAIAIIAVAYTATLNLVALGLCLLPLAGLAWLNRRGTAALWPYLGAGILLWLGLFAGGVHPTVAGVATALFVPAAPLHRLEHALARPVAFGIVPLFAFANAGVPLGGADPFAPLPLGIALGLILGKPLGVFASIRLAIAAGLPRPAGAGWAQIGGMALLAGIGFTMSLFIGGLAFAGPAEMDAVRIGVLAGSLVSALAGYAVLRFAKGHA